MDPRCSIHPTAHHRWRGCTAGGAGRRGGRRRRAFAERGAAGAAARGRRFVRRHGRQQRHPGLCGDGTRPPHPPGALPVSAVRLRAVLRCAERKALTTPPAALMGWTKRAWQGRGGALRQPALRRRPPSPNLTRLSCLTSTSCECRSASGDEEAGVRDRTAGAADPEAPERGQRGSRPRPSPGRRDPAEDPTHIRRSRRR
jgi:hypothetical protein